jgi:hypothetical protein
MAACARRGVNNMAPKKDSFARYKNNARTSLRRRKRTGNPMADYDRLPSDLRGWLSQAALPWSPRSVLRVWRSAMKTYENDQEAVHLYMSQLEAKKLKKEAKKIWGFE